MKKNMETSKVGHATKAAAQTLLAKVYLNRGDKGSADVLLMLAEALDGNSESWDLIDQVRNRAGLEGIDRNQNFIDALAIERRHEFAFEIHRWHDLRRLYGDDKTAQILEEQLNKQLEEEGAGFTVDILADDIVRLIPKIESELNNW